MAEECSGERGNAREEEPAMDVIGDANLGAVMLVLLLMGLMNYSMRDPCTCL